MNKWKTKKIRRISRCEYGRIFLGHAILEIWGRYYKLLYSLKIFDTGLSIEAYVKTDVRVIGKTIGRSSLTGFSLLCRWL